MKAGSTREARVTITQRPGPQRIRNQARCESCVESNLARQLESVDVIELTKATCCRRRANAPAMRRVPRQEEPFRPHGMSNINIKPHYRNGRRCQTRILRSRTLSVRHLKGERRDVCV